MPDLFYETKFRNEGHTCVAGIDEAGRGPWAGPVSAAAVILPENFSCPGLDDSKKISPKKRDMLFEQITSDPNVIWAAGIASCEEIDKINILRATHLAMRRAVEGLSTPPNFCIIDGTEVKNFHIPHHPIIKGDSKSLSIAAASIIAKVTRDRMMAQLDAEFPVYGFAKHQGYGTKQHHTALKLHGPCIHHRRSVKPIAALLRQI